jgi:hypothetical protein
MSVEDRGLSITFMDGSKPSFGFRRSPGRTASR